MSKEEKVKSIVNKESLKKWLTVFNVHNKGTEILSDIIEKIFGCDSMIESPIGDYINGSDDMIITLIAEACCVDIEELNWFIYECNLGTDPKECKLADGTEILVDSIDAFLDTI